MLCSEVWGERGFAADRRKGFPTAEHICTAAKDSVKLVQDCFEAKGAAP